jgi:membrane protein DedA with SNARE-associated domain
MIEDALGSLPPVLVYLLVATLVTAEVAVTAGLVLPAATALIALGLLANAGTVAIAPSIGVAVASAWLGGSVAYHSGRRLGPRTRTNRLGRWIGPKRWDRADRLLASYGGRAVFVGQWVVVARTLVPRLAGMSGMPYRRFLALHAPAAALWAAWLTGASYLLGASYDQVAGRVGHAGGALAALTAVVVALVLIGGWIGRHPDPVRAGATLLARRIRVRAPLRDLGPVARAAVSLGVLAGVAGLLVVVTPVAVRFSGLDDVDASVAEWARSEWASDTYLFALQAATSLEPEHLIGAAVVLSLARWWWSVRRFWPIDVVGALTAFRPALPLVVFAVVLDLFAPKGWRAPDEVVFPPIAEYGGPLPTAEDFGVMATMAATHTAKLTAAVGLLVWLLTQRLRWSFAVAGWTVGAVTIAVISGSWVYLGWSRVSETVAAILLGLAWTTFNAAIWSGSPPRPPTPPAPPAPAPPALPADQGQTHVV